MLSGIATIQLNRNYPSGEWATLGSTFISNGQFEWMVAGAASEACRIRVMNSDSNTVGIFDISDANFAIIEQVFPALTVMHPNGGERLTVGSSIIVDWAANFHEGDTPSRNQP